jgi:predicted enzyme related to lactoylglutathione lyase
VEDGTCGGTLQEAEEVLAMIKKIGCIEVPVSDMEKAAAFYENVLGLEKTYEHPVWTSFDIAGTSFALAASGTKRGEKSGDICKSCSPCVLRLAVGKMRQDKDTPTATSLIYLAVEDLDGTYRELQQNGVEFIAEPKDQEWGDRTAVMLDPDKNILVLAEYS